MNLPILDKNLAKAVKDIDDCLTIPPIPKMEKWLINDAVFMEHRRSDMFSAPIADVFFQNRYARAIWVICRYLHNENNLHYIMILQVSKDLGFAMAEMALNQCLLDTPPQPLTNGVILAWADKQRERYLNDKFSENYAAYGRDRAIELDREILNSFPQVKSLPKTGLMDDQIQEQIEYQHRIREKGGLEGYRSFQWWDEAFSGFIPGDLSVIAARPGGFKTGLAINLALQSIAKNQDLKTCFVNLEMPSTQMLPRFVQAKHRITKADYVSADLARQTKALASVFSCDRLVSTQTMHVTSEGIVSTLKSYYSAGFKLFFIDYLQLIRGTQNYGQRDDLRIMEAINSLKKFKDESEEVHICCLAQLNRNSDARKTPHMGDLAGSSYIEQAAALILILSSDNEEETYTGPESLVGNIAKNRHGKTGRISVVVDKARMTVYDKAEALEWAKQNGGEND